MNIFSICKTLNKWGRKSIF